MVFPRNRFQSKGMSGSEGSKGDEVRNHSGSLSLYPQLADNLHHIRTQLGHSPDITIREFEVGSSHSQVAMVYMNGITDMGMVNEFILHSLMIDTAIETNKDMASDKSMFDFIRNNALSIGEVKVIKGWNEALLSIMSGNAAIFIDGWTEAIGCGTKGGELRAVTEPSSQVVIRGPKDGFTESIGTNVALVRRRIKSSNLWLESMRIGKVTQTDVAIMYIKGVADDKIVQEIKKRLNGIDFDSILESGYIEQLIQDKSYTIFPTIHNTERPDSVASNLLEGRIAIFVDGTPFILIAPMSFFGFFQVVEDYYHRFEVATVIRLLRYAALIISLFFPAIYVSFITFHQEMIPTTLYISLAAQRESVPFPAFVEALMMEVTFEILREAGIRLPRAVGQAVSIVGALVLGQAAVEAGIITPAMVIVVALTGISSFTTPAYSMALSIRLLRFTMIIASGFLGFFGIVVLSIIILAHMCGLNSFGIPYMSPLAPFIPEDQKDTLVRFPFRSYFFRPRLSSQSSLVNVDEASQPSPQNEQNGRGSE
ncbi:spore germination protein [Paenibacillus solisilvae]|uniref:Spore germination protein n=1 Tax=Paenibacillus solisilvae TaxID=2486751 RepID=A0ABW0VZ69_9BACL